MLKKLFNNQEEKTHRILQPVCENHGVTVCPKVRIADVLPIEKSGISEGDYGFCLKAHFDFVAYDREWNPLFAVEFDGSQHQNDPRQNERDARKNRLCERFGLPLLRVSRNHAVKRQSVAFLEYMIDLHFGEKAVQRAVARGDLSLDEEYFPGTEFPGTTKLRSQLHQRGIYAPGYSLITGSEKEREHMLWYLVSDQPLDHPIPHTTGGRWKTTTRLEILKGFKTPVNLLVIERTAILTDCSPNFDILGVHGWHIGVQFARFLCFQEAVSKIDRLLEKT